MDAALKPDAYVPATVIDGVDEHTDLAALLQNQENQIASLTTALRAVWDSISQLECLTGAWVNPGSGRVVFMMVNDTSGTLKTYRAEISATITEVP